jgi:hypothetical protein
MSKMLIIWKLNKSLKQTFLTKSTSSLNKLDPSNVKTNIRNASKQILFVNHIQLWCTLPKTGWEK